MMTDPMIRLIPPLATRVDNDSGRFYRAVDPHVARQSWMLAAIALSAWGLATGAGVCRLAGDGAGTGPLPRRSSDLSVRADLPYRCGAERDLQLA